MTQRGEELTTPSAPTPAQNVSGVAESKQAGDKSFIGQRLGHHLSSAASAIQAKVARTIMSAEERELRTKAAKEANKKVDVEIGKCACSLALLPPASLVLFRSAKLLQHAIKQQPAPPQTR